MGVVGIDENGLNPSLAKGGFEAVRKAVKTVGREGWSAGQILEQVSLAFLRHSDTNGYDTSHAQSLCCASYRRMRQSIMRGR
jgi:hypothetical protein